MNDYQTDRFVARMVQSMFNTVAGKRIAVLGCAFKADTGDTRESPAIRVCRQLVEERAQVVVTDPQALDNARRDMADLGAAIEYQPDPYAAACNAHALAVLTDWHAYAVLDYQRIYTSMIKPAALFDGRNCLDHAALHAIGFDVYAIGKVPLCAS